MATIQTDIGTMETSVAAINASITSIDGSVVTIQTDIGTINTSVAAINASIISIDGNVATIQTDIGTIDGRLIDIEAGMATIAADVGIIKAVVLEWTGDTASFTGAQGTTWDVLVLTTSQELDQVGVSADVLGMRVSGEEHTQGASNIFIPRPMLADIGSSVDRIAVTLDDEEMSFSYREYPATYMLSVAYTHSTHTIQVWFDGLPLAVEVVQPDTGCTVETHDGTIRLEIPAGAIGREAQVIVQEVPVTDAPPPPGAFKCGATCFVVEEVDSLVVIEELTSLAKKVTITVRYSEADLAAAGGDPSLLTLCRYDEDIREWIALPTTVNTADRTLSATTDRFSMWMVMVAQPVGGDSPGGDSSEAYSIPMILGIVVGASALIVGTFVIFLAAIIYGRRRARRNT